MTVKQFAVIGIGRFGESVIKELVNLGHEVMAIDSKLERVNEAIEFSTHAIQADSQDENVLKTLGIRNFDAVIVAIGENMQANVLTTVLVKELGAKYVIAKARNPIHGKVLEKVGADMVIYPERDMGIKVARSLACQNFLEQITLSPEYSIIELIAPHVFTNKTLDQINLRQKTRVNILAIRHGEKITVAPGAEASIHAGDILVVLGHNDDLEKLKKLD